MKTGAAFAGFVVSALIGVAVGYAVRDAQESTPTDKKLQIVDRAVAPAPTGGGNGAPAEAEEIYKVPVGTSYQKGPDDALVTIVEFSDFQCPFCSRVSPTLEKVFQEYKGQVRLAFKHQPLPFHLDAPLASEYALAAGEQGKFWEMHDKLFANQTQLKEENLKGYAQALGLDQGKIDAFIASGKGKQIIQADQELARQVGANGTPAFFINGEKLSGAQPYEAFARVIDAAKARAEKVVASGVAKRDVYAKLVENGRTSPPPPKAPPPQPALTRQKIELVEGTPAKGGKQPLVTIVEFSDFQCPFCSRVNPTLQQVLDKYGDDVQVQFRNQPLPFHQQALPAAKAALAAHMQGKFWPMHDKLFENQRALGDEDLKKYAQELGLDVKRFEADMASDKVAQMISKDQGDAAKWGARGTPTLFANGVPIRGAQPFEAFQKVIDEELAFAKSLVAKGVARSDVHAKVIAEKGGETLEAPAPAARPTAPAEPSKPVDVAIGKAPLTGKANAPIQVVVFSDFECPFCGRVNPSLQQIKKEYGDKVSVAFKHFPLSFHPNAKPAAIASLAAHRQGKFWEMHDKLFENQRSLSKETYLQIAKDLGLDVTRFEKDLDDPELASWVDSDMRQGGSVGVNGTPASFINGRLVSGAQPFEAFKAIIEEELKKKG